MKIIVALLVLTCHLGMGISSAQMMFMGEGYSSSQLSFLNSPNVPIFEPNVENYWGSYITGQQNMTAASAWSNMNIWMNTFPLNFESPVKIASSSFASSSPSTLSAFERNSQSLTRDVNSQFLVNQLWVYPLTNGSLSSILKSSGTPGESNEGQILSQNIITLFNV